MKDIKFNGKYIGIVEDINDPLKVCRCRIRVGFMHGKDIPTEDIPWANPKFSIFFGKGGQSGMTSVPKKGSIAEVTFSNGDQYSPEYELLQELADDVKDFLQKEYIGTHILGFDGDEDLKMFFTKEKGLTFYLKGSRINIGQDRAITIEHFETSSIIELRGGTITMTSDSQINATAGTRVKTTSQEVWADGKTTKIGHEPQYAAVLGEPLFALFELMASTIDAKLQPSPGLITSAVKQMKKLILSDTVKVSK